MGSVREGYIMITCLSKCEVGQKRPAREGYIMVTCLSKCEVGQKRPAKMRIEGLQTHKRELFGPQRTVSDLVYDKAVDAPRPGFGSNKVLLSPVGPTVRLCRSQTGSLCCTSGRVSGSGTPCVYERDAFYNTL